MDEALAHRIEAGADLFLMPSRYEPCGLSQLYSLRYGTVPVVHATGGLDDTVADVDAATGEGTGFKFSPDSPEALRDAVHARSRSGATRPPGRGSRSAACARTSRGSARRAPTATCTARCSRRPNRAEDA